jgi:hypothetical protein
MSPPLSPVRILTQATRERVEAIMGSPCDGYLCEPPAAAIFTRRRTRNAIVTVHIQCGNCGRSRSGALKRADFPYWQDFTPWSDELAERHRERINTLHALDRGGREKSREDRAAEAARRRAEYARWLLTSPEWRTLRDRVWRRAGGICEACLANQAGDIHHVTYALGRLPPAWELRAVCRSCHDRLHDWTGGEE